MWGKPAVKHETHGFGYLDPKLARSQNKTGVGVANAGGEFPECAGRAGMTVCSKQHFAGPCVPFFGESNMAYPFVAGRSNIVEVFEPLLRRKIPDDLHVAVG